MLRAGEASASAGGRAMWLVCGAAGWCGGVTKGKLASAEVCMDICMDNAVRAGAA